MSTSEELQLTLVQPNVQWEDRDANLEHYSVLLSEVRRSDVIIFPEMFSTGFSMRPQDLSESSHGPSVAWMQSLAAEKNAAVVASFIANDGGKFFNRLVWMTPDGQATFYDKRHLFTFANEDAHYSAGKDRLIVEFRGWRICPVVCYDLRFPVWLRNQSLNGAFSDFEYDLLIVVANWPEARRRPWINLLEARAHENQAYVAGVNRVGVDGNNIAHSGDSRVFSPKGEPIVKCSSGVESVTDCTISKSELEAFREKFGAWRDKDAFSLIR